MEQQNSPLIRVTYVTPLYPPEVGGAAEYYRLLVKEIAKDDRVRHVAVVSPWRRHLPIVSKEGKISVYRLIIPRAGNAAAAKAFSLVISQLSLAIVLLWIWLVHGRNDVVQVHSSYCRYVRIKKWWVSLPLYAFLAAARCVRILDVRDRMSFMGQYEKVVDYVICASLNIHKDVSAQVTNVDKCIHVPLPLDVASMTNDTYLGGRRSADYGPHCLFVGDIDVGKGVLELASAVDILRQRGSPFSLLLVGPASDPHLLQDLVKSPFVQYLGVKVHSEVVILMRCADVVVLPSASEGLPRVCLEALWSGSNLICSSSVLEIATTYPEFVLDCLDRTHIADRVEQLFQSNFIRDRYDFSVHDPSTVAAKMMALYVHNNSR